MLESLVVWGRMKRTLPFIITDTSMFLSLTGAQMMTDYALPPDHEQLRQVDVSTIIDKLTQGTDGRTLIMTRIILNELFPTASGRLDFMMDDNGKPCFPVGAHPYEFRFPSSLSVYDVFSRYAQQGNLRCYESFDAMAMAGEMTNPRGGIVIVDTDPPNARRSFPENGRRISKNLDYYEQVMRPNEVREKLTEYRKKHLNKGDDTLVDLSSMLLREARMIGICPDFMLVTGDLDLTRRVIDMSQEGFAPIVARPYELLWAMEMDKGDDAMALESGVAANFTNSMAHERALRGYQLVRDVRAFTRGVRRATHWLVDSRTDAAPQSGASAMSERLWADRINEDTPKLSGARGHEC